MQARLENRPRLNRLMMSSILGALVLGYSSGCGGSTTQAGIASPTPVVASPTPVVASPTPDAATRAYVALIHNYWIQQQIADGVSNGSNLAARVCLGLLAPNTPNNVQLIDPSKCRERAVAILAALQKFLTDLGRRRPPSVFAADDQVFRSQLPKAIAHVKALISVTRTGTKDAVLNAAVSFVDDVIPLVTNGLDDVDPSVVHM